jgi:uncharacterized protein (DUF1330 family)
MEEIEIAPPDSPDPIQTKDYSMSSTFKLALGLVAATALAAIAVHAPRAQTAKLKAYYVSESDITDAAASAAFVPIARQTIAAGGGRLFRTGGGRVVSSEGAAPPKRVVIIEWDSVEAAEAFYKSKAWTDIAPQRDKGQKTLRSYIVETIN